MSTKHRPTVVQAIHTAVRGRARYKIFGLYGSPAFKQHLESQLARYSGIHRASASPLTGNVLVLFRPDLSQDVISTLLTTLATQFWERRTGAVAGRPTPSPAESTNGAAAAPSAGASTRPRLRLMARRHTPPPGAEDGTPWYCLQVESVLKGLDTSSTTGLTADVARRHLRTYGPNAVPEAASRSGWRMLLEQFASLPVALLGAAAGISLLTGGMVDALVIGSVVIANAVIGYVTESQSERTIQSLKRLVRPAAVVRRDGAVQTIAAEDVVPGEVIVLRPGSYVVADARLIDAERLSVDESALTGESLPALKDTTALTEPNTPLAERHNMVYMGTLVAGGQGAAVVVATGSHTEMGRIQRMVESALPPETPMERQLDHMGRQLVLISSAVCGLVFGIGLLRGYGLLPMLTTSISLAVAAVPEGLPTVATTSLALGIRTMRRHRVLIRQLAAVEALGSVQTICLDKTGTITHNRMQVVALQVGERRIEVHHGTFRADSETLNPYDTDELIRLMHVVVLCSESTIDRDEQGEYVLRGTSTENALLEMAIAAGVDLEQVRKRHPLRRMQHRAENRNFMSTLHTMDEQRSLLAVKGSPDEVLALCTHTLRHGRLEELTAADRTAFEIANERLAGEALRVLAIAYGEDVGGEEVEPDASRLVWLGLVGMMDPIRDGVHEVIAEFHQAGIDTVMITGDQSTTAYAIGKELALSRGEQIESLDSTQLTNIDAEVLSALASRVHIFARVSPSHKLQIVQALQRAGKIVAMTGDGINDGPALKAANIGIAMGHTGTDVAREVADVVLEDDDLDTMIVAVSHGRTIYNNIRKSVHFLLSTNLSEIMVMFGAMSLGLGQPLNAMQLLWINLLTDVAPGLALALEAPEPDVLRQPPRDPDEPIMRSDDLKRIAFESAALSAGALGAYGYGLLRYGAGAHANTLAFTGLTAGQLLHALSCRSEQHGVFDFGALPANGYLSAAVGGSLALQGLALLVPGLRSLLGLTPLTWLDGAVVGVSALGPLIVNEASKPGVR